MDPVPGTFTRVNCCGECEFNDDCMGFEWYTNGTCHLKQGWPRFQHVEDLELMDKVYSGHSSRYTTRTTTTETSTTETETTVTITTSTTTTTTTVMSCWTATESLTTCRAMSPYPEDAPGADGSAVTPSAMEAFCDSQGGSCGGFIFTSAEKQKALSGKSKASAVLCAADHTQPFGTMSEGDVSPTSGVAYRKTPCTCATLQSPRAACSNWDSLATKQSVMLKGGDAACYDHCRHIPWCTQFLPQASNGSSEETECLIVGDEACTERSTETSKHYTLDRSCITEEGPDSSGWYKLSSASEGRYSQCITSGATWGCTITSNLEQCKDNCAAEPGTCNAINFCDPSSNISSSFKCSVGNCCRLQCDGYDVNSVQTHYTYDQGGWDVFFLDKTKVLTTSTTTTTTTASTTTATDTTLTTTSSTLSTTPITTTVRTASVAPTTDASNSSRVVAQVVMSIVQLNYEKLDEGAQTEIKAVAREQLAKSLGVDTSEVLEVSLQDAATLPAVQSASLASASSLETPHAVAVKITVRLPEASIDSVNKDFVAGSKSQQAADDIVAALQADPLVAELADGPMVAMQTKIALAAESLDKTKTSNIPEEASNVTVKDHKVMVSFTLHDFDYSRLDEILKKDLKQAVTTLLNTLVQVENSVVYVHAFTVSMSKATASSTVTTVVAVLDVSSENLHPVLNRIAGSGSASLLKTHVATVIESLPVGVEKAYLGKLTVSDFSVTIDFKGSAEFLQAGQAIKQLPQRRSLVRSQPRRVMT